MRTHYLYSIFAILIIFIATPAFAQDRDEEAREHLVRGMAAIEMAKSESGLGLAVSEFKKATEIAPNMAAAWYNLGSVQSKTGELKGAIVSYQRYLALAPKADDARRVKDEVIKLRFKLEQTEKVKSLGGLWINEDGTLFTMTADGNRLTLETKDYRVPPSEATYFATLAGDNPVDANVELTYRLDLQGNSVTGSWHRAAYPAGACTIPEEVGELTGEIADTGRTLILRYPQKTYYARSMEPLLGDSYCDEVRVVDKQKKVEKKLTGPLPTGGIGVDLNGIYSGINGWGNRVPGWTGSMKVLKIEKTSAAYAAGLRRGDKITAIDGAPLNTLTAGAALIKLFGEPGSEITLSIEGGSEVRMRRVDLTNLKPELY